MKRWQRRTLALLSTGGGAVGVTLAVSQLVTHTHALQWLFTTLFIGVYATGAWWGVRLLERAAHAPHMLFLYWAAQVPTFMSPIAGYSLASGFHVTAILRFAPLDAGATFALGSHFNYSLFQWHQPWTIGINVFALAVAVWLWRWLGAHDDLSAAPAPAPSPPVENA